jgi:hypothetical protein
MSRLFLALLVLAAASADIVDRIAITVDHEVITQLQIDEELHVTAFLNHASVPTGQDARSAAADRIVAQLLVAREMRLSRYPAPSAADIDQYLAQIRSDFGSQNAYDQSLREYRITESVLRQHLAGQLSTLSFIELRFRPNLDIPESEIQSFYNRETLNWSTEHPNTPQPSFEAARPGIMKLLTEEHTNQVLDTWLEEARKQVNIIYLDKSLQ